MFGMDGGLIAGLITLFLFIAAIVAFFVPFFIWRIRNEIIITNQNLKYLVEMAELRHSATKGADVQPVDPIKKTTADKNLHGLRKE